MVAGIVFVGAKVLPQTTFEKKTFNHEKNELLLLTKPTRFLRQNQSETKNCEPEIR